MKMRAAIAGSGAFVASVCITVSALAQNAPQLCPANVSLERWDNCFGQFVSERTTYTGGFAVGKFSGVGTLVTSGGTYSGEFRNGKFEGQGILVMPDGTRFIGGWSNGVMEGPGRAIGADGREVAGNFSRGVLAQNAASARQANPTIQNQQPPYNNL